MNLNYNTFSFNSKYTLRKKRYKSCHWGCTFSKRYIFVPKGCILDFTL